MNCFPSNFFFYSNQCNTTKSLFNDNFLFNPSLSLSINWLLKGGYYGFGCGEWIQRLLMSILILGSLGVDVCGCMYSWFWVYILICLFLLCFQNCFHINLCALFFVSCNCVKLCLPFFMSFRLWRLCFVDYSYWECFPNFLYLPFDLAFRIFLWFQHFLDDMAI